MMLPLSTAPSTTATTFPTVPSGIFTKRGDSRMYSRSPLIYSIIRLPPAPPLSLHHRSFLSSLRSFLSSFSVRYGSVFHLCCTVSFGNTRVFSSYSFVVLVEGTLVRYSSCRAQYISVGPVPFLLPSIILRSLPLSYSTWFHFWWVLLVALPVKTD